MKKTVKPKKVVVKRRGWAVLATNGEWSEQFSLTMSKALRDFYKRCEKKGHCQLVSATITYTPIIPKKEVKLPRDFGKMTDEVVQAKWLKKNGYPALAKLLAPKRKAK